MGTTRRAIAVVFLSVQVGAPLRAGDPPVIRDMRPRSARPGSRVTLVVTGEHLTASAELVTSLSTAAPLIVDDPDLQVEPGRAAFRLAVGLHEALGSRLFWVRTASGLSNPVVFTVDSLEELEEREPNEGVESAAEVDPPCVLLGTLGPADLDHFRFHAGIGERLVMEVEARRLGSAVDPTLRLLRASGQEIALSDDEPGLDVDCRIDHTFEAAGDYVVEVHDSLYARRSPSFYRLRLAPSSYAEGIFPLGGRAGSAIDVRFEGDSLEAPRLGRAGPHTAIGRRVVGVALPRGLSGRAGWPFPYRVGVLPELIEEVRGESAPALDLEVNTTINGRVSRPGEVDLYQIAVTPGRPYRFEVEARGLGSWLDPVLEVVEEGGRRHKVDDTGDDPDPRLELTVGESVHTVAVSVYDLHHRGGGAAYSYRLTVREDPQEFELVLKTPQVNLPLGATAIVEVECRRQGYTGPVDLDIAPVPGGFTVAGGHILAGESSGYLTLTGPRDGTPRLTGFEVFGEARGATTPLVRRAEGRIALTAEQRFAEAPLVVDRVKAAVTEASPFSLSFKSEATSVEVVVGHSVAVTVVLARRGIDDGEAELSGVSALPGVTAAKAKAGPDQTEVNVTIAAAAGAAVREGDLLVRGQLKPKAGPVRTAATPALNVRVVQPFSVKLTSGAGKAGPPGVIEGAVVRTAPFAGRVEIRLGGLPAGLNAGPITVEPGAAAFRIDLTASDDLQAGVYAVTLEATTSLKAGDQAVVHAIPPVGVELKVTRERVRIEAGIR